MFVLSHKAKASRRHYVQHGIQVPPEFYPSWFTYLAGSDLDSWRDISRTIGDKQRARQVYHGLLRVGGLSWDLSVLVDLYLFQRRDFRFIIEADGACSYACADSWCGYPQR